MKRVAAAIVFLFLSRLSLAADVPVDEAIDYKLSYSYFHTKNLHANDLNLPFGSLVTKRIHPISIKLEAVMKE